MAREILQRRIFWTPDAARVIIKADGGQTTRQYKWHKKDREFNYRSARFESVRAKHILFVDGMELLDFEHEEDLKEYIIRGVYGLEALIPSEVLADAGLVYEDGSWIDEWYNFSEEKKIVPFSGTIFGPYDRNLVLPETGKSPLPVPNREPLPRRGNIIPLIARIEEPPDEDCFFVLESGGCSRNCYSGLIVLKDLDVEALETEEATDPEVQAQRSIRQCSKFNC